jgi:peptidoglycan hydrolase FlgJ
MSQLPPISSNNSFFNSDSLDSLKSRVKDNDTDALKTVAKQLESFFLKQVLEEMRKTTFSTGLMGDEQSGALGEYTQWMDSKMAETLSEKGMGLSDALLQQWVNTKLPPKK